MIRDALAGKRIAITGTTGFLGTAILERLLWAVPDCEVALLIRPGRRSTVEQRAKREIFKNDAFDRLRQREGGRAAFDEMIARRVHLLSGDVSRDGLGLDDEGRALLASCDVVIHSAATVAFDSPLDSAIEINLLGPTRIARTLHDLGVAPHLVAVSTCYVAGNRRGKAPEQMLVDSHFHIEVDWRAEVDGARRARADAEARSRTPELLTRFRKEARAELGAAGGPLLADKTENLRKAWVKDEMVEAGRARAASLGWPDAYAYTKALGEQALAENRGDVPVSIVRPAIIESALSEPSPGWIRGFRMAEPIILSYAKGLLKEFPGVPEGIVDVIPVDIVVGAICATAAKGPDPAGGIDVVQAASGSANPLHLRRLVDLIAEWFTQNPLYDAHGQPIVVPKWRYPGRDRVRTQLVRATKALGTVEKVLGALPLRGSQADFAVTLEEKKDEADRALQYVTLYGAYAECEAVYGVTNLLALHEAMGPEDQTTFGCDPRVIDWDHYVQQVHLPTVVVHGRVRTTPGKNTAESRETRLRRQVLAPERQLVAFDLENTLIASNVVTSYAWLATRNLDRDERLRFALKTFGEAPKLLAMDRKDRSDFLRYFYRRYTDADVAQIDRDAAEMFSDLILTKSFPAAIRRVREHRRLGHRTVLITGALDFVVKPLEPLFDDIIAAELGRRDGRYVGEMSDVPATGETRAAALLEYAEAHDLDPSESVAYADSTSDLPMLEAVGFPVAVNPETRLAALARKRGWLIEQFDKAPGAPKRLLPIPTRPGGRRKAVAR